MLKQWPAFVAVLFSALLVSGFIFLLQYQWLTTPVNSIEADSSFEIVRGASFNGVAAALAQRGIIERPRVWAAYALITRQAQRIQAGEYLIPPGLTPQQLLQKFVNGDVRQYQITFIEGWNIRQLRAELRRHPLLLQQTAELSDADLMETLGQPGVHPEGQFYPDSYHYVSGTSDLDLLRRAHDSLQRVLKQEWQQRSVGLPYETPYEALIMASVIEKETAVAHERGQIAGVFARRLQKKMRLQTDPTVIYGLGEAYNNNLTRKHLTTKTPYNTYMIRGLPPTPIAMVGRPAIHAAMHPESGSSLYFVAKGDGSHIFSDTLEQHNRAVDRYQRYRRAENYRSTP